MATPNLRFKEFDGDWSTNKIEDISNVTSGGTPSRNIGEYWNGDIPWVTTSLVDFNIITEAEEFITQSGLDNSSAKLFPKDTILMAMYGQGITRGKVAILGINATTNQACAAIKLKNDFDTKFIFQNLMNRYDEIRDLSNEGGQKNLSAGIIKEICIHYPQKEEQTQIASFLSAVDEKINQLTQKHQLLSQYKQGMMQKLFSQQIRFKADDGSEFGEWDTDLIRDVFTNKSKNFNPQSEENLPCIELEHLSQNTGKILGTIDSCEQQSTKNLFEKNYVLFGKLRPYLRKFAKPQFKGVCSSEIWVLTGIKISNDYLFQYIQSEQFSELTNIQSGSKMPRADWNVISEADIESPCLEEQTKIANFLSTIDQKIEVVAQQIEQAKQWKKGLLQQMFV